MLAGRYLLSDTSTDNTGTVQVTPPGLTVNSPANNHSLSVWLNSILSPTITNELRVSWSHLGTLAEPG